MKAVLALAFLAVAQAGFPVYDDSMWGLEDFAPVSPMWSRGLEGIAPVSPMWSRGLEGIAPVSPMWSRGLEGIAPVSPMWSRGLDDFVPISPMWSRAMFQRFGFIKPAFDADFISFAKSIGVSDHPTMDHMLAMYDEPAVMFFMDPVGGIVSYFADAGIQSAMMSPELRTVFPTVLGAADSMAIVYHPDSILGSYRSVLPGHFFVPTQSAMLAKVLRAGLDAFPMPMEHVILRRPEIASIIPDVAAIHARFDIDEFPFAYKHPVALSFEALHPSAILPSSALMARSAFPGLGVPHFTPLLAKAAHPLWGGAFSPAWMKSGFPLISHEVPAIRSGFLPSLKFPLVRHVAAFDPLSFSKPWLRYTHYPVPPVTPLPVVESTSAPIVDDLRAFSPLAMPFPGYFAPRWGFRPSFAPPPFIPSPAVPAVEAPTIAGSSAAASSMASAAAGSKAGTFF